MDSSSTPSKSKSALPSYLTNGSSPLHHPNPTEARDRKERESLYSSIKSSNTRKELVDVGGSTSSSSTAVNSEPVILSQRHRKDTSNSTSEDVGRDDATQQATPTASRPHSPFTQHPTVDFDGLSWPSTGTRDRLESTPEEAQERLEKLSGAIRTILECIGEDPDRQGLMETPERYAKAMMFFTKGYEENLRDIVNGAVFHEDHDELVIVRDIEIHSLCEHHLVPFVGKMHIGYIPNRRVLGLSKLARIAEMFARRLQLQERLTKQVALALSEVLQPQGVAVVMESSHLCMEMRGVQKTGATTMTSCMLGRMRSTAKTREEFLNLISKR